MTRIAWTTDPHLNFLKMDQLVQYTVDIVEQRPDVLLVGGDIGEAKSFPSYLRVLAEALSCPIYFVLGNHDFYGSSIESVRFAAKELTSEYSNLRWLPLSGVVELSPSTCLIGHDCWGDAKEGNFLLSGVILNDYHHIRELAGLPRLELMNRLHALGDEASRYISDQLMAALKKYDTIYLLTHVPPFRDVAGYRQPYSDDQWAPHMVCKSVGDVLQSIMADNLNRQLIVLSGHGHGGWEKDVTPNIKIVTGKARYGKPRIQGVFEA